MALLHAYFDASQTQPTGVATIAGYLGSETAWVSVEKQWSENLRTWGLEEFRLSQIMAGRTKVGRENAAACVKSFGRIIGPSDLVSISAGLRSDDWTDAEKTADYSARFPTSYHYCLHMLFGILNEHMELYRF